MTGSKGKFAPRGQSERVRKKLLRAVVVAGVLVAATLIAGYNADAWLKGGDAPRKADLIVVLSGSFARSMFAADLYRDGYAPAIALTEVVRREGSRQLEALGIRLPTELEIHRKILAAKGVPDDRVRVLPAPVTSTADEADEVAAWLARPGATLPVVTSPFHVRRSRMILERALEGRGVALTVCATPYETFPDEWWRSQDAAREVLLEWAKLVFYVLGGRYSVRDGDA